MQLPVIQLPRPVPPQRVRQPQDSIPQTRDQREELHGLIDRYVNQIQPVPPLSIEELRRHTSAVVEQSGLPTKYHDYVAVVLNGRVWRDSLASVPYERRLLLLPKCLRVEDHCPAPFDDFGLLCKQCGQCSIQDLQNEAERLGYAVLVAEGSALVMALIQTGKIDAIVGVSCLSVLEKAFPYMESAAIPGVAIPLLQDDCRDTTLDMEWLWEIIHLTSEDKTYRLDLDALRREVDGWFEPEPLSGIIGAATTETERIAYDWLSRAGKRWRPFLAVCAYKAIREELEGPLPAELRKIAVAVECFHKASLIHDDIEDDDALRYGQKTLHEEHGMPVAVNVGDFLLGEGYRLLAECNAPAEIRAEMLKVAAAGHRTLCLGQGAELCWGRLPQPLSSPQVLEIFRQKTAPAFEVALRLGAALAGADAEVNDVLVQYSESLGIAYQIRDDLSDLTAGDEPDDLTAMRPTLPLAVAYERTKGPERELLAQLWRRAASPETAAEAHRLVRDSAIEDRCRGLLESYKEQAVRSLAELSCASLKGLLRRVIGKIFTVEVKGWCSEFETRNAASRPAVAEAAR
ncbi:MAG TPA: polyprenyl synthetase family protein [Pirellulales bacterium]|jgi:geranylgeranyl pyrophosphate synthase|nr:polyprenyl synthetase family protein [Pirellulales bacterium]